MSPATHDAADLIHDPGIDRYQSEPSVPGVGVRPGDSWAQPPAHIASVDTQRGVPAVAWVPKIVPPITVKGPEAAAQWHLARYAEMYGLTSAALAQAKSDIVHDTGRGAVVVRLVQAVHGFEVFPNQMSVVMDRDLGATALLGSLHGGAVADKRAPSFAMSAASAIVHAVQDAVGAELTTETLTPSFKDEAGFQRFAASHEVSTLAGFTFVREPRVKAIMYRGVSTLTPAYLIELELGDSSHPAGVMLHYAISANDGSVLYRETRTVSDSFTYRVFADQDDYTPWDGPMGNTTPHPTGEPDGFTPSWVTPVDITVEGFNTNPNGGTDPWLPAGATETFGNNVDAYADHGGSNRSSASSPRAPITATGQFLHTYDAQVDPVATDEQINAATTQLFYVNNYLHDYWYDSGFNEAAKNAQQDNYGRGGAGGDPLRAEAQDNKGNGGAMNNANMNASFEGSSPRMQMYLWDGIKERIGADTLSVTGMGGVAQDLNILPAGFGPTDSRTVMGGIVLVDDGTGTSMNDGCEAIQNDVSGAIALVDRGNCTFVVKAENALSAGARGVIIANNADDGTPAPVGGDSDVNIPVVGVSFADGANLKTMLEMGPVDATLKRAAVKEGVRRDGTIDNHIVAHEWGHYIHLRLVSCGGSASCGGMSEGFGDYIALHMLLREEDDLDGVFALSPYSTAVINAQNYTYFGIRRFPYSTQFDKNGLTFGHVADKQALPNVPKNQVGAANNFETHNSGEVWAQMLFEGLVDLARESKGPSPRYSFTEAKRRMADYVVAGLIGAPSSPTFTQQRDAILAAAAAADKQDFVILARAFARRGFGTGAISPASSSRDGNDVVENFDLNGVISFENVNLTDDQAGCDGDGILDGGETGTLVVSVQNLGPADLANVTAEVDSDSEWLVFPEGRTLTFATIPPFETVQAYVTVQAMADIPPRTRVNFTVRASDPAAQPGSASVVRDFGAHFDQNVAASRRDDVEATASVWTPTGDIITATRKLDDSGDNHVWAIADYETTNDESLVSPVLEVSVSDPFVVSLMHRYQFEGDTTWWDGGVIEITMDGGSTWKDVSDYGVTPGYIGTITDQAGNPLAGREAFSGQSAGWPNMSELVLDFGMALAGEDVQLRFRVGCDQGVGDIGWELDDLNFEGIDNTPFGTVEDETGTCVPTERPIANAGQDMEVMGGEPVLLDGSGSYDPEGDALTFEWSQVDGPAVALNDAGAESPSFVAPEVMTATPITLQLIVSDGVNRSIPDRVVITVLPEDDTPTTPDDNDGGTPDDGDGTPDDMTPMDDGGVSMPSGDDDGGCSCSVPGSGQQSGALIFMAVLGLVLRQRRRR